MFWHQHVVNGRLSSTTHPVLKGDIMVAMQTSKRIMVFRSANLKGVGSWGIRISTRSYRSRAAFPSLAGEIVRRILSPCLNSRR
jgi:hypothetical protein